MSKRMLYHITYEMSGKYDVYDDDKVEDLINSKEWYLTPFESAKAYLEVIESEKKKEPAKTKKISSSKRKSKKDE